ncbi:hypothetical protein GCM10017608_20970 [Agromyces luteolus]|uniref:Uncharacterized protein n=1 Tax=Agromyces luteolus TaxID=88373 RepID=A0A7C9I282_9MICO|nr:hypothetical protein [Agromyces luteolus]MUN08800.1 hypothetical protein [Agromyces luteolus]GLK28163.1 hypothetical protein GCM10017608_20970 [Agromyces luteolus]
MIPIDLVAALATLGFVGVMVGCTIGASRMTGLEQRAGMLDRRNPALADALRRAESFSDLSRGGFYGGAEQFSAVCTPGRRSWIDGALVRSNDSDLRVEPPEETLPPMPATVVALAGARHVADAPRPRHPSTAPVRPEAPVGQSAGGAKSPGHQPTASG